MLNNLIQFNFAQARYVVLKEFDLRGPIANVLQSSGEHMSDIVMSSAEDIEQRNIALREWHENNVWSDLLISDLPNDVHHIIVRVCELIPHYILCYSDYNWNEFISAWLEFCNEYVRLLNIGAELSAERFGAECPTTIDLHDRAASLAKSLQSTLSLLEIGMGYTQLIASTERLLHQMEAFQQDRPNIVRVSDAYLTSLGYKSKGRN